MVLAILLLGAAACSELSITVETETPDIGAQGEITNSSDGKNDQLTKKETPVPNADPTTPPVEEPDYSFDPVTYVDPASGFELLYPSTWTTHGGEVIGPRGYHVPFYEGDDARMGVNVYLWSPTRDLQAWSEQRELSWTGSGGTILSKREMILQGDHVGLSYIIQTITEEQAFFLLTTIGERYFELAGVGDLELLAEIASTVRIPEFESPP